MSVLEDLADDLARDVIAAAGRLGDDSIIGEVAKQLSATSSTMEEAYMTSIRMRLAERRARRFLDDALKRSESAIGA